MLLLQAERFTRVLLLWLQDTHTFVLLEICLVCRMRFWKHDEGDEELSRNEIV